MAAAGKGEGQDGGWLDLAGAELLALSLSWHTLLHTQEQDILPTQEVIGPFSRPQNLENKTSSRV